MSTGRAQVSRVYNTRVEERRDVFVLSKACPRGFFQKRGALWNIVFIVTPTFAFVPLVLLSRRPLLLRFTPRGRDIPRPSKTEIDRACKGKVQQTRQGYQRRLAEKSIASATRMEACDIALYVYIHIGGSDFMQTNR